MYSKRFLYILFLIGLINTLFISSHKLYPQNQFDNSPKITSFQIQKQNTDLIGGLINKSNLKIGFLNNGRFSSPYSPELPNAQFGDYGYLGILDLWIGIPDGPWAPQVWNVDSQKYVSQGPTVSGTCFKNSNTDWSTISMTQDVFYTTQLLYSDIYKPSALFDFILAPTSDYELTWPRNPFTGFREWPGRWKKDSLTGKPMKGVFFGDQDIFISFDDKANSYQNEGYFISAEVLAQVVGFQEGSVSNMVIFDLQIINTSQFNYFDAYIGIYYRAGHPWYYLAEKPDRNLIKTGYIKNEQSIGTNEHLQYNLSYSYNYNNPIIHASFTDSTHFGVQFLKTPFAEDDQTDNDDDGVIDEQGEELGLTGWHFIPWESIIYFQNNERLQYQILAGDSTGIDKSWLNKILFFTDSLGNLDPNFDSSDRVTDRKHPFGPGLINRYTSNLLSCGPVNWASGDTLNFIFAILVADDIDALKASARMARKIIDKNYHYSGSPPPPKVTAVAQDGKVTLYWDRSAESATDFLTGYQDFEGYKIYRTESDPANNEWGQPNYDDKGNFINFIPIDRCDLDNGINGYETVYPHQFLGDDTGLFHTWTDSTVTNGITYWYSVCSYDHGIISDEKFNPDHYPISPMNECPKGIDPESDVNLVKVIPGVPAPDLSPAIAVVEKLAESSGNGLIEPLIIDQRQMTGHDYLITFEDTTYGYAVYDLFDETENKTIFEKVQQTNGGEGIIFDGIQLIVQRYDNMDVLNDRTYWYKLETGLPSPCTWTIRGYKLTWEPYPFEYDIRFIDRLEFSHFLKKTAPFEIWNTVLNQKCLWDIYYNSQADTTDSLKNTWTSDDRIYIWDKFIDKNKFTLDVKITSRSYATYQGTVNIPPEPGDVAHIALKRPFLTGDQFRIKTTAMQQQPIHRSDLKQVKVVPNPYIVEAGWELSRNESKIQFIHLPSKCKIHIYTLSGDRVRTLVHDNPHSDYEFWDLLNNSNLKVSYGLYIFAIETDSGEAASGKFVILR